MAEPYVDRRDAGRVLAEALRELPPGPEAVVLALPRGGVPVGLEVAKGLGAVLDVLIVRKLGVPWQPELAMGAIASGGARVLNPDVIAGAGVREVDIERVAAQEMVELERRERTYRGDRPPTVVSGRRAILVDDGLATGASMRAAVEAVRQLGAAEIVVAAPVAARESVEAFASQVDYVVCPLMPEDFWAVGYWYRDFRPTTDDEVTELLADAQ